MQGNAISSIVGHLDRFPAHTLGLRERARCHDMLEGAIRQHHAMRGRQVPEALAEFDEVFAGDLRAAKDALHRLKDSLANDPDPIGEPAEGVDADGRPTQTWDAGQVALMAPFYAAYVRAHRGTVPSGRNDLFTRWLADRRQEFFTETLGAPVPRWEYNDAPFSGTTNSARWDAACAKTEGQFSAWLLDRFPPALMEQGAPPSPR